MTEPKKCNKKIWALGVNWYCVLPVGHDGGCEGEMPDILPTPDAPTYNGHITITKNELGSYPLPGDPRYAPTEGWEERFDELIPWEEIGWKAENVIKTKCKAFVTQALAEQKARMVEEVEGMKDEQLANAEGLMDDETRALKLVAIVKNQVCDSIIKALSK